MRYEFARVLTALAEKDPLIYLLTGDVGGALFDPFRAKCPGRHIEIGVAEQSMVGMAAGMAMAGLRPVVYTITPFLIERAFEQIKLDVHCQKVPVGLVGYSGYPTYGPSHIELDAPKLMSLVTNIRGLYPEQNGDVERMLSELDFNKPWFLSLKKAPTK
jgi:transketolase